MIFDYVLLMFFPLLSSIRKFFKDVQLQQQEQQQQVYLKVHHTLQKQLISMAKNHLLKMKILELSVLICLLCRYQRITYYYRNPLDRFRTDQTRTKQISLSSSPIFNHVIHTHNLDKVMFNCEIYLTGKLTY